MTRLASWARPLDPLDVSRAAYGPHQAGLDFDEEPVRANRIPSRVG